MDESSPVPSFSAPSEESTAQQQARLRRERREAKIKAGGSARLNKITSLSGRPAEPEIPITAPTQPPSSLNSSFSTPPSTGVHGGPEDPEEVDISQHFYTPGSDTPRSRQVDAERQFQQLQQMMGNAPPPNTNMQGNPFAMPGIMPGMPGQQQQQQAGRGAEGAGAGEEDPMLRMLQQVMGGMPGGGPGGADGLPPALAAMFGGGASQAADANNKYSYIWKIVHAIFALTLGVYITTMTTFTGSHISRTTSFADGAGEERVGFFWVFATAELVLQSTRFFIEKGRTSQSGVLAMVAGFLPEPWKGYVGLVGRYSGIWNTVVEDAMVVVFVLGLVAWWMGGVR